MPGDLVADERDPAATLSETSPDLAADALFEADPDLAGGNFDADPDLAGGNLDADPDLAAGPFLEAKRDLAATGVSSSPPADALGTALAAGLVADERFLAAGFAVAFSAALRGGEGRFRPSSGVCTASLSHPPARLCPST